VERDGGQLAVEGGEEEGRRRAEAEKIAMFCEGGKAELFNLGLFLCFLMIACS